LIEATDSHPLSFLVALVHIDNYASYRIPAYQLSSDLPDLTAKRGKGGHGKNALLHAVTRWLETIFPTQSPLLASLSHMMLLYLK
jgi:hypothetical protein